jgi:Family of unknown function (DUF6364)
MTTKLTLSISAEVIHEAKEIASKQNTSLSKMVESYLKNRISSQSDISITNKILQKAPANKTAKGEEKNILKSKLQKKYAN